MSDDLKNRGQAERSKVNVHEDWEVRWWCQKWGITKEQLVKVSPPESEGTSSTGVTGYQVLPSWPVDAVRGRLIDGHQAGRRAPVMPHDGE